MSNMNDNYHIRKKIYEFFNDFDKSLVAIDIRKAGIKKQFYD